MSTLPTVLISGASEELTARIEQLIRGQAELSLVESVSPDDAKDRVFKAKLVWVELESDPETNITLLEKLIKAHPNTFFVVSKEDLDPELVKRAMQFGALDFLDHKGWAAQIRSVVRRVMAKEFGSKPNQSAGGLSARQPARQSSWGQLNSVKVQPNTGGFKRAEPNRLVPSQSPQPQPLSKPAPAPPTPAPKSLPPTPPEMEPEPAAEVEEIVEQPYEEPSFAQSEEPAYAEDETAYEPSGEEPVGFEGEYQAEFESDENEQTAELEEYPEAPAAEGSAEIEMETEAQDGDVGADLEYAAEAEYQQDADDYSGDAAEDESIKDYQGPEYDPESEDHSEIQPEPETEPEPEPESEPVQPKPTETPETPPAVKPKARWDDLDSLISKEAPKTSTDKKPASKWGELGSIQSKIAKEPAQSSDKKWSDLDAIVAPKPPAVSDAPAASSSKWGDLDSIGKAPAESESPEALESSFGDLDSIGKTPKAFGKTETGPSSSKWGDLNSIGAKSKAEEPAEPGSKWGNLDSISSRGSGGGLKTNARSFIKPKTPEESPTRTNSGLGAFADLGLAPGQADASGTGGGTAEPGTSPSKWGDLDGLGAGGSGGGLGPSASENANSGGMPGLGVSSGLGGAGLGSITGTAGSSGKPAGGDVDSNPSAFKNRFGRKTQNIDLATSNPQDALTGSTGGGTPAPAGGPGKWGNLDVIGSPGSAESAGANDWGDLNSIPTPKSAQEASGGNWGGLDSIPTPKGSGDSTGPKLVEGALPKSRARNEASEKWKSGMGAELSEGQREFGELADKIKEKTAVRVKVSAGWKQASVALAVALLATAGYLSVAFFSIPEPPAESVEIK